MASAKSQNPLCWNHETLWWHFRRSKPSTQCPAPRHQRWNAALWVHNGYRPASFPAQLGTWEVRRKKTLDCVFTPARPQEAFGSMDAKFTTISSIEFSKDART